MDKLFILGIALLLINCISFFIMYLDKVKSRKTGAERIPEGLMFFAAAAFGSAGVLSGMLIFRHKTAKWYFMVGVPLIITQNIAALFLVYSYIVK